MSFNKSPLYVAPYSIFVTPGDSEKIPIDPEYPISGLPTATLIEKETGLAVLTTPTVEMDGELAVVTVAGPPVGTYVLEVTFTGTSGRIWSLLLAIISRDR